MLDSPQPEDAARELLEQGDARYNHGYHEDAKAIYSEVIGRFGASNEPALQEYLATALLRKAKLSYNAARIAVLDEFSSRFGAAPEIAMQKQVADAKLLKAEALRSPWVGRDKEAPTLYDEIRLEWDHAEEPPLREFVVQNCSSTQADRSKYRNRRRISPQRHRGSQRGALRIERGRSHGKLVAPIFSPAGLREPLCLCGDFF